MAPERDDAATAVMTPSHLGGRMLDLASARGASTAAGPASVASARARSRRFLIALGLVSLVPLVGVPVYFSITEKPFPGTLAVMIITGSMHVAATSFFAFDRQFWPVIRESPLRCMWSLAWAPLAVLGSGLAIAAAISRPWAYLVVIGFQNAWLFYHYQRQNFGLISFISTNVGCGRVPPGVNTAMNVAAAGAWISMMGVPGFCIQTGDLVTAEMTRILWSVGAAIFALSLGMMAWAMYCEPRLRQNAWLLGGLVFGMMFFLPSVLFDSLVLGFLPYAMAHGAQYILMMSVLSGRSSRGWIALLTMVVLAVSLGYGLDSMRPWPWILVATGLVQVHFLLDAKVWRLREPQQRAIMNQRFDFLLTR